ncbi:MAG: hypothetical protein AAF544_11605 [Bacteroidota bacterium]
MKLLTLSFLVCLMGLQLSAQDARPPYCDELPSTYSRGVSIAQGGSPNAPELPRFATTPTREYKVQVAILRYTDPSEYPFHPSLVARYRPCEQVWVVESRESYASRSEAEALQRQLQNLGYEGAYLTELVAYQ